MVIKIERRQCSKNDYEFVYGLIEETIFPLVAEFYVPEEKIFKDRFENDYQERQILLDKGKRIGFYQLTKEGEILDITGVFLIKEYRGMGIGKRLMEEFEKLGYKKLKLKVWENNRAVNFYKKLGYKIVELKNHKLVMEKTLKE